MIVEGRCSGVLRRSGAVLKAWTMRLLCERISAPSEWAFRETLLKMGQWQGVELFEPGHEPAGMVGQLIVQP